MNVFVTGGAGYIGSVCVEELINAGHAVTVFDNLTEGHRSAVDPRATFIEGCLSDVALVKKSVRDAKAEAVLHFAATALVGESMTNPSKYFRNNVASGLNLLDAAFNESCARIHGRAVAFGEIIKDGDGVSGIDKFLNADRSDVTRAACDKNIHGWRLIWRGRALNPFAKVLCQTIDAMRKHSTLNIQHRKLKHTASRQFFDVRR